MGSQMHTTRAIMHRVDYNNQVRGHALLGMDVLFLVQKQWILMKLCFGFVLEAYIHNTGGTAIEIVAQILVLGSRNVCSTSLRKKIGRVVHFPPYRYIGTQIRTLDAVHTGGSFDEDWNYLFMGEHVVPEGASKVTRFENVGFLGSRAVRIVLSDLLLTSHHVELRWLSRDLHTAGMMSFLSPDHAVE